MVVHEIERRDFLKVSGTFAVVSAVTLPTITRADGTGYTASRGNLLVDQKKCQGCMTCWL